MGVCDSIINKSADRGSDRFSSQINDDDDGIKSSFGANSTSSLFCNGLICARLVGNIGDFYQ